MKANKLIVMFLLPAVFLTGCLVLGSPRHVYLHNPAKQDSVMLSSYPNGFYRYSIFKHNAQVDSIHIYDPLKRKTVAMNKGTLDYYYDLRAKVKQRELLSTIVIRRFSNGQHQVDTFHFDGNLRKF